MTTTGQRSSQAQRLAHLLAAAVILLHGYGDLEKGHAIGWLFLAIGAVALTLGIFHHRLHARFPKVEGVFHAIEAVMAVLIGLNYLHAGKTYVPWVSMAAAVPYGVLAARTWLRKDGREAGHQN